MFNLVSSPNNRSFTVLAVLVDTSVSRGGQNLWERTGHCGLPWSPMVSRCLPCSLAVCCSLPRFPIVLSFVFGFSSYALFSSICFLLPPLLLSSTNLFEVTRLIVFLLFVLTWCCDSCRYKPSDEHQVPASGQVIARTTEKVPGQQESLQPTPRWNCGLQFSAVFSLYTFFDNKKSISKRSCA